MLNILNLEPNKVTTNYFAYPLVLLSEASGDGKTYTLNEMLSSLSDTLSDGTKKPLFVMLEDRYQHIPNIMAVRLRSVPELMQLQAQLRNPKVKSMYSCVVFDTADKLDSMIEKYVASSKEVEISGDLNFGKGNKYIKSKLHFIDELRAEGWSVYFTAQSVKNTNILTQETTYEVALNKETWKKVSHDAFLVGMLTVEGKDKERYITFEKSSKYPNLKDSVGMPKKIKARDFKAELDKAIHSIKGATFTEEDTVNKIVESEVNFADLKERGNYLGGVLVEAGKLEDAFNILRTHIGIANEDTKEPKMFDDLLESQIDLAQTVVIKLEELCAKFGISV